MASAFGFDLRTHSQGVVFGLTAPAKKDRIQTFAAQEAELRKGVSHLCVRGATPDENKPLSAIADTSHLLAEDFLDIVAVEERTPCLSSNPMTTSCGAPARTG